MGFKEVLDLDCDNTTALGGRNKKTGKANPTKVEGYFLGAKTVENKLSRTGTSKLYVLQTPKGTLGVWGKTDLDRKMGAVPPGAMIRITQSGTVETPKGDMYKFKVEVDTDNTIEVDNVAQETNEDAAFGAQDEEPEGELYETPGDDESGLVDEEQIDEPAPVRAAPPKAAANVDKARQDRVKALLGSSRR